MSRKQIERMRKMADRIKNLMEEKYGVDLEDCTNIMKRTLAPSIPDILRSCGMEGTQLPATTAFRPRLGKALNEAYAKTSRRRHGAITGPSTDDRGDDPDSTARGPLPGSPE